MTAFSLAVLNPGGRDRPQSFPAFAGRPEDAVPHPPINYHAYAACTGGAFYRDPGALPEEARDLLLILRRDLGHCLRVLKALLPTGRRIAISLKESGLHQLAMLLDDADNLRLFHEICALAPACLASTPDLVGIYAAAGARHVQFIPTPYPLADPAWSFEVPPAQRRGLFIGTREWNVPSRNHAASLLTARQLRVPVTVVNTDGRSGRKRLDALALPDLRVVEGKSPYAEYLRLLASHRLILQSDRSAVPGQVAGDALLCRLPCVGGDGAIERIAFPGLCGFARNPADLQEIAAHLLRDDDACAAAIATSQRLGLAHLSFEVIARSLAAFFSSIPA